MHLGFFTAVLCFLHCYHVSVVGSQPSVIPGYLDFDNLPETNFSCQKKVIGGYYADIETGCQMFHVCTIGQKGEVTDIKFLCLNGTVFDQETRVCERVDEVDCSLAEDFFNLNLELYGSNIPFGFPSEDDDAEDQSSNTEHESKKEDSTTHAATTTTTTTTSTTTTTTTTTTPRPTFPSTTHKPSTSLPNLHFLSITTHRPPTYNSPNPHHNIYAQQHHYRMPQQQQNIASTQRNQNNQNYQSVSTTLPTISYTSQRFPISKPDSNKNPHNSGHLGHFPISPSPGVATLQAIRNNFNNGNSNDQDNDDHAQFEDDLEDYEGSGNGGEFEEEEEEEEEEIVINRPGPHANRFPVTTIGNDNVRIENNGAVHKSQPVNGHSAFTESLAQRNRQSIPHGNQGYVYHRKQQQSNNQYGGNNGYDSDNQNSNVHSQHQLTTDYILSQQKEKEKHQHHGGFNSNNQFSYSTSTPTSSHYYHQQNGPAFSSTIQPFLLPPLLKSDTDVSEYESQKIGRQVQNGASLLKRKLEEEIHQESAAHSHHSPVKFQLNKPGNPLFTTPSVAIVSQTSSTSFVSSVSKVTHPTHSPSNGTILGISTVTSIGTNPRDQHNPHNLTIDSSVFKQNYVETTPPATYDEYLEGDVQKDPFYIDVPRIASKKRQRREANLEKPQDQVSNKKGSRGIHRGSTHQYFSPESVLTSYPELTVSKSSKYEIQHGKKHQKSKYGKSSKKYSLEHQKTKSKSSKKNRKNSRTTRDTNGVTSRKKRQIATDTGVPKSADIQFQTGVHVSVSMSPSHYVSPSKVERKNPNLRTVVSFQNRQRFQQTTSKSLITEAIFEPRRPSVEVPFDTPSEVATPKVPSKIDRARTQNDSPKESQRTTSRLKPSLIPDQKPRAIHHGQRTQTSDRVQGTIQPPVELPSRSSGRGGISLEAFGPSVSRRKINKSTTTPENRNRAVNTPASTFLANYPVEMVELKTKSHMVAMVPTHNKVSLDFLRSLETQQAGVDSGALPGPIRSSPVYSRRNVHANSRRLSAVVPTQEVIFENQRRVPSPQNTRQGRQRSRDFQSTTRASERIYESNIRSRSRTPESANQNLPSQYVTDPTLSVSTTLSSGHDQIKNVASLESSTPGQNLDLNSFAGENQPLSYKTVSILDVPPVISPTNSPRSSKRQRSRESSQQHVVKVEAETSRPRHSPRNAQRGSSIQQTSVDTPSRIASSEGFQSRRTNLNSAPQFSEIGYPSTTNVPFSSQTSPEDLPRTRVSSRGRTRARVDPDVASRRNSQSRAGLPLASQQQQVSESQVNSAEVTTSTRAPLPETSFTCADKVPGGYYADLEADCQLFHICSQGRHGRIKDNKFLCGPGTRFNQQSRTCQSRDLVDCELSASLYHLNDHFTPPAAAAVEPPPSEPKFEARKLRRGRNKRSTYEAIHTAESKSDESSTTKKRTSRQADAQYYDDDYDFEDLNYDVEENRALKSETTTLKNIPIVPDKSRKTPASYEEYYFIDYSDPTTTKRTKVKDANIRTLEYISPTQATYSLLSNVDGGRKTSTTLGADYYLSNDYVNDNYEPSIYKKNETQNNSGNLGVEVTLLIGSGKKDTFPDIGFKHEIKVTTSPTTTTVKKLTTVPVTFPTTSTTTPKVDYEEDYYYYDEPAPTSKVVEKKAQIKALTNQTVVKIDKTKKEEDQKATTPYSGGIHDDIADFENDGSDEDLAKIGKGDGIEIGTKGKIDVTQIYFTTNVPEIGERLEDILNSTETLGLSTLGPLEEETGNPLDPIREVVYRLLDDPNMFDDNATEVNEEDIGSVEITTVSLTQSPELSISTVDNIEVATTSVSVDVTPVDDAETTNEVKTTTEATTTTTPTTTTTKITTTTKSRRLDRTRSRYRTTNAPVSTSSPSTIQSLYQRTRSRPTPKYHHDDVTVLPAVHIKPISTVATRKPTILRSRDHLNRIRQNNLALREKNVLQENAENKLNISDDDSDTAKSSVHATKVTKPEDVTGPDSEEAFSTLIPLVITPSPKLKVTSMTSIPYDNDDILDPTEEVLTSLPVTSPQEDVGSEETESTTQSPVLTGKSRKGSKVKETNARNDGPSLKLLQSFARLQDEKFYPEDEYDVATTSDEPKSTTAKSKVPLKDVHRPSSIPKGARKSTKTPEVLSLDVTTPSSVPKGTHRSTKTPEVLHNDVTTSSDVPKGTRQSTKTPEVLLLDVTTLSGVPKGTHQSTESPEVINEDVTTSSGVPNRSPERPFVEDPRGFSNSAPPHNRKPSNNPYFSCTNKELYIYHPDPDDSRIFHYCSPGFHNRQKLDFLFICDNHTTFNVKLQKCE